MHVVGTAGHVDHGKSTLVLALTGIDPDRLKEEKAREMTIDLGFAWLSLPDGEQIGLIDVPGHRDFIENMLAGVGGIDAVIFVVAADEGAMPQTREHLAIINLLRIPTGVIALTKTDLVRDPGWLDLVQLDLGGIMAGTVLENAPIVPVSARTGEGLDTLKAALIAQLTALPAPPDNGRPRLWVDRVFSVSGFGTVVTGTLLDGTLSVGQDVELLPGKLRGRIRGLQSHNQTLEVAHPGSRVAVNVSGIEKRDARRGNLLALPGMFTPTMLAAVRFQHLPDAPRPLRHNAEVKFFCGSAETIARTRLIGADMLAPGETGWLQLELRDPVPLVKGDRFILRYPSPGETIGGGEVIDPAGAGSARRRLRRSGTAASAVITRLEALSRGNPAELIIQAVKSHGKPISTRQLSAATGFDRETITDTLQASGGVVALRDGLWIGQTALDLLMERLSRALTGFHKAEPLRPGQRAAALQHQLKLDDKEFDALIDCAEQRQIAQRTRPGLIGLYGHVAQPSRAQKAAIDRLMAAFASAPYTPPSYKEAAAEVGEDVLAALIEWGEFVRLSPDVLLTPTALREFATATRETLAAESTITIKALRDRVNTSRKYAQAVLEYFDGLCITRRQGDDHVLASGEWEKLL